MKKVLIVVGVTVLACILIIGVISPIILKSMQIEEMIKEALHKQFGREVDFSRVKIGLLPTLSLQIKELSVKESDLFGDVDVLTVDTIALRLNIPALLLKRVQIEKFIFDGVVLSARDYDENNNIKVLIVDQAKHVSETKRLQSARYDAKRKPQEKTKVPFDFLVDELIVKNVTIDYEKLQQGKTTYATSLNIKSGRVKNFGFLRPVDFDLFVLPLSNEKPIRVNGRFLMDPESFLDYLEIQAKIVADEVRIKEYADTYFPDSDFMFQDGFASIDLDVTKEQGEPSLRLAGMLKVKRGYMPAMNGVDRVQSFLDGGVDLDVTVDLPFDTLQIDACRVGFGETELNIGGKIDVVEKLISGTIGSRHCDLQDIPILAHYVKRLLPASIGYQGVSRFDFFIEGNYFTQNMIGNIDFTQSEIAYADFYKKPKDFPCIIEANIVSDDFASLGGSFDVRLGTMTMKGDVRHFSIPTLDGEVTVHTNKFLLDSLSKQFFPAQDYVVNGKAKVVCNVRGNFSDMAKTKYKLDVTLDGVDVAHEFLQVRGFNGSFLVDPHAFEMSNLDFYLFQSYFKGWLKVDDYKENPNLNFDLYSSSCNLDTLMVAYTSLFNGKEKESAGGVAPQPKKPVVASQAESRSTVVHDAADVKPYMKLNGEGALFVEELIYLGTPFTELKGVFQMNDGMVNLKDCSLRGFSGNMFLDSRFDLSQVPIYYSGKTTIFDVSIDEIYSFAQGTAQNSLADGTLSCALTVSGAGFSLLDVENSLIGSGKVIVKDGELKSIDILQAVSLAKQFFGLREQSYGGTRFNDIEAQFIVENGLLTTEDIYLSSDDLSVKSSGSISFRGKLDFDLDVLLAQELVEEATHSVDREQMVTIPIHIGGTVERPRYAVAGAVVRKIVDQFIQKGLNSLLKRVEKGAPANKQHLDESAQDSQMLSNEVLEDGQSVAIAEKGQSEVSEEEIVEDVLQVGLDLLFGK